MGDKATEKEAFQEGLDTGKAGGLLNDVLDSEGEAKARQRGAEANAKIEKEQEVKEEAENKDN